MVMVAVSPRHPKLQPSTKNLDKMETLEAVAYVSNLLPDGSLTVPAGYLTDGASIPYGARWLVGQPFTPRFQTATLIHDYLYSERIGTQKDADDLFLELLKLNEVGWVRRRTMWVALRIAGWIFWWT